MCAWGITAATLEDPDALVVKFQTIVRDGKEIVVGRLKVATVSILFFLTSPSLTDVSLSPYFRACCLQNLPAPNEHAFILRRYDTGAISVTTMFKAAFPGATEEEEEREMRWVSRASFSPSIDFWMRGLILCFFFLVAFGAICFDRVRARVRPRSSSFGSGRSNRCST